MTRAPLPILASERTAARLLDMPQSKFSRYVRNGALPAPVRVGEDMRWRVADLEKIASGEAARPPEEDDLEL